MTITMFQMTTTGFTTGLQYASSLTPGIAYGLPLRGGKKKICKIRFNKKK